MSLLLLLVVLVLFTQQTHSQDELVEVIRCHFVGVPELVSRPSRDRRGYRFRHAFSRQECTGGKQPSEDCMAGIHQTYHCGRDEQWKVSSLNGGSMEWTNWRPCENGIANVTAHFLCGPRVKKCRFRGQPTSSGKGWMSHEWTDEMCSGKYEGCIVANNEMTHCGGTHDWVIRDGTTTWYDSFVEEGCDHDAVIGMDVMCEDSQHIVNCKYQGEAEEERCLTDVEERHANMEQTGKCLIHRFDSKRDCGGKDVDFEKECSLSIMRSGKHCGQEEDWRVGESGEVRWWNTQSGCGNVTVEVDYYCGDHVSSLKEEEEKKKKIIVSPVGGGDVKGDGGVLGTAGLRGAWEDKGVKRSEGWRIEAQGVGALDESH